jgi:hypothetical protein
MMMDELLQQLAATPKMLAHLVVEATEEALDTGAADEWSPRLVMAHLRDDEMFVMRVRLERLLGEHEPVLVDFDEKAWVGWRNRGRDRREHLLGDFALQRQASMNILQGLRAEDWDRGGRHEVSGPLTVRSWVEHWLHHDREHVAQIERGLGESLADVRERRARRDEE